MTQIQTYAIIKSLDYYEHQAYNQAEEQPMNPSDHDLPKPKKPRGIHHKGGRKKMSPDEKTINVGAYLPPDLHEFITKYAELHDISLSKAIARAIELLKNQG